MAFVAVVPLSALVANLRISKVFMSAGVRWPLPALSIRSWIRLCTLGCCAWAGADAPKLNLPFDAVAPKLKPVAPKLVGAPATSGWPGFPTGLLPNGLVYVDPCWKVDVEPALKPVVPKGAVGAPNGRLVPSNAVVLF